MPFGRPTLSELRQQVAADIAAGLPGATALLRYSNLGILGDVQAALVNGTYGYLDWIALQSVPFTATGEFLEGWAALKGVIRHPASAASGSVVLTGTNGSEIPAGANLVRSDGVEFRTVANAIIAGGEAVVSIVAVNPGSDGNSPAGSAFTLTVAIAGVNSTGVSLAGVAGGQTAETDDSLRSRMLAAYASPPQGGSKNDYLTWALGVAGITRAWVFTNQMGSGTVSVFFMMDTVEAAFGGFPQGTDGVATGEIRGVTATGDQLAVANAIYEVQPITALVYAVAPAPDTIDLTISGLSGASTGTKNAIIAAIKANLLRNGSPGGTTHLSDIEVAIASVPASTGFVITAVSASAGTVSGGTTGNIVSDAGCLPVLGTITWA